MKFASLVAMALALAGVQGHVLAQAYPSKPVRLILNVSAGVVGDIVLRAAAQVLSRQTGQPWVVENYPGGNFVIGANACKRATPDGYAVCMTNLAAMSLNPHVLAKLSYDPEKDFTPITNLFSQVTALVASGSLPANTVAEFRDLAVASPGKLNFGTLGPASNADILRAWLNERWKTDIVAVHYKGMPGIVNSLLAGEIHVSWAAVGSLGGNVKSGKLKLLALNTSKRATRLPDVPTFAEVGLGEYPGLVWWGMVGPAGIPEPLVQRINADVVRVFNDSKFGEVLDAQFVESIAGTPAQFAAFMKLDRERVGELVRKFNISPR